MTSPRVARRLLTIAPIVLLALTGCMPQPPALPDAAPPVASDPEAPSRSDPAATAPAADPTASEPAESTGDLDADMTEVAALLAQQDGVQSATWEGDGDIFDLALEVMVGDDIDRPTLQPIVELMHAEIARVGATDILGDCLCVVRESSTLTVLAWLYPGAPDDMTEFMDAWEWAASLDGLRGPPSLTIGDGGYAGLDVTVDSSDSFVSAIDDLGTLDDAAWLDALYTSSIISVDGYSVCHYVSFDQAPTDDALTLLDAVAQAGEYCVSVSLQGSRIVLLSATEVGEYESDPDLEADFVERAEELGVEVEVSDY